MTTARAPRLEKITPANLEAALALRVRPDQEFAVDPVAHSLAEAYVRPGKAWPRVIVDDDRELGALSAESWPVGCPSEFVAVTNPDCTSSTESIWFACFRSSWISLRPASAPASDRRGSRS